MPIHATYFYTEPANCTSFRFPSIWPFGSCIVLTGNIMVCVLRQRPLVGYHYLPHFNLYSCFGLFISTPHFNIIISVCASWTSARARKLCVLALLQRVQFVLGVVVYILLRFNIQFSTNHFGWARLDVSCCTPPHQCLTKLRLSISGRCATNLSILLVGNALLKNSLV